MPKNTIISSFRKIPGGFAALLAMFLATEIFLNLIRPHIVTIFWNKFVVNEHALIDMRRDFDYLLMGDSVQKTGIDPTKVSDGLLNLGLPGAKPASMYLLLERYLKNHRPPKAIFLFVDPQNVRQAMHVILKYFVTWPEFGLLWKDLTWDERGHFLLRYWVSLDERLVSVPLRQIYTKSNQTFIEELRRNHGYMPLPNQDVVISDDHFARTGDRPERGISTEKRDFVYLDKLIKLARANNIKVFLVGNLLPKELYEICEKTGFNGQWLTFLELIKGVYPDVEIAGEPILYLENRYFADMSHVNKDGCAIYTAYFKEKVFKR